FSRTHACKSICLSSSTLFRTKQCHPRHHRLPVPDRMAVMERTQQGGPRDEDVPQVLPQDHRFAGETFGQAELAVVGVADLHPAPDRKSTRLNSSHVKNSYAVI